MALIKKEEVEARIKPPRRRRKEEVNVKVGDLPARTRVE